MKRAHRSLQHHVLYRKYNGQDSEISALLGKCGFRKMRDPKLARWLGYAVENQITGADLDGGPEGENRKRFSHCLDRDAAGMGTSSVRAEPLRARRSSDIRIGSVTTTVPGALPCPALDFRRLRGRSRCLFVDSWRCDNRRVTRKCMKLTD